MQYIHSYIMTWPITTHFSKAAAPSAVPNTETGRTYLFIPPEERGGMDGPETQVTGHRSQVTGYSPVYTGWFDNTLEPQG